MFAQAPLVRIRPSTVRGMETEVLQAFASRLHEICDEKGLPRERGRQTQLAEAMKVTPNAARKWLLGEGMPEMAMAIRLANWGGVNVGWLLQGDGAKRGSRVDIRTLLLEEALHELPATASTQALEFLRFTIARSENLAEEQRARYTVAIDHLIRDLAVDS